MKESHSPPKTNHTVNAEVSTIKSFFTYLFTENWIEQIPPIKSVASEAPEDLRRDYLSAEDWRRMKTTILHWTKEKGITPRQAYNRSVLWRAILIMINSGIRIGELKKLKWSDIQRNPHVTGDDALIHHIISIRAETTKTGKPRRVNTPTMAWFDELRRICGIAKYGKHFPFIPAAHKDDYVFCKEGKPDQPLGQGTWDRLWVEIKERCRKAGGTYIDEKNITWYSFRHSYISNQVQRNVPHLKLARNCGTGIRYIEGFYYHHEAELSTEDLNTGREYFKKLDLPEVILD